MTGLGRVIKGHAFGVDPLQALLLAVQGLRLKLEALGIDFRWMDGDVGDTGIPRVIPISFGLNFSKHAEIVLDKETTKYVQKVEVRDTARKAMTKGAEPQRSSRRRRK